MGFRCRREYLVAIRKFTRKAGRKEKWRVLCYLRQQPQWEDK